MRDKITIYQGSTGLNIVDDPVRIAKTDLQVAVNVSIDSSGRVKSRRRTLQVQNGNFHSLFCAGKDCFVIKDTALYQVALDGSLTGIRSGLTDARMAFAQAGDRTYYTNGFEKGVILGGISSVWGLGTYIGPTTHRHFSAPPTGHHLEVFAGRMLIAQDNVLWWSEPFNFGLYDLSGSFVQFHTKITMVKSVDTGIFLSTENSTYFLSGTDPKQWALRKVTNYPAIEWTVATDYFSAADLGFETIGMLPVWASKEGAIMGTPDGMVINLNKKKVIYPESAREGFGGIIGFNFIHGVK
jgi:hypothetical protein